MSDAALGVLSLTACRPDAEYAGVREQKESQWRARKEACSGLLTSVCAL